MPPITKSNRSQNNKSTTPKNSQETKTIPRYPGHRVFEPKDVTNMGSAAPLQVVGAAIRKNDTILCAQRGPSKSLAGYWEFPGGKIEAGETPQEALKREIEEELLCEISVGPKICSTQQHYDFGTIKLTTFLCSLTHGEPSLTEHTQLRWISKTKLVTLDWAPADRATAQQLMTLKWAGEKTND